MKRQFHTIASELISLCEWHIQELRDFSWIKRLDLFPWRNSTFLKLCFSNKESIGMFFLYHIFMWLFQSLSHLKQSNTKANRCSEDKLANASTSLLCKLLTIEASIQAEKLFEGRYFLASLFNLLSFNHKPVKVRFQPSW